MAESSNRLTVLEERYAYQERLLEKLNEVLYEQQKTIDLLEARIRRLEELVCDKDDSALRHEKPPHY
jgi:SlyX protein